MCGNIRKIILLNQGGEKLIFDLGFHDGDTASFYLRNYHKVIGVECNPYLRKHNIDKFHKQIKEGSLTLVDKCVSDKDGVVVPFYISNTLDLWSSTIRSIAERVEESEEVFVETITLRTLIEKYGCPYYCKIDIEGNDVYAIRSLKGLDEIPQIVSVEAECLGKGEVAKINMLDELRDVGYREFFIVDQRHNLDFRFDFSKRYKWCDYEEANEQLKQLKREDFEYGVWADIYARR